jgi:geranylgeranyl pyrophosphate synthase
MSNGTKLWTQVNILLKEGGQDALEMAKKVIAQREIECKPLRDALRYFMQDFWFDYLHPTLISLACQAVGGNHTDTVKAGAAIVLLAGAADVHDDIIDQSVAKGQRPTVFGKFGKDVALLAGDALLFEGLYLLHEACEQLPQTKRTEILKSIKNNFYDVSSGVAKETYLRKKTAVSKEEFLDIVTLKVSTVESTMKMGSIFGNGTEEQTALLGHYGRTLGVLLSLRDEFIDVFEPDEVKNRYEHETLPLPILLALQDKSTESELLSLLQSEIGENSLERILELSVDSPKSRDLVAQMKSMIEKEKEKIAPFQSQKNRFELLLNCTLEDL